MPTFDLEKHDRERGLRGSRMAMIGRKECYGDYGVFFRNKHQSPNLCESCVHFKDCLGWEEQYLANAKNSNRECFAKEKFFNSGHVEQPCDECTVNAHCGAVAIDMRAIAAGKSLFMGAIGEMPFKDSMTVAGSTKSHKVAITSATVATPSTSDYCFPVTLTTLDKFSDSVEKYSDEKLLLMLKEISFRVDPVTGKLTEYGEKRKSICLLSTVLNQRQSVAPRFRSMLKPGKAKGLTAQEIDLSRDRQLIDMHWLWCAGHRTVGQDFKPIFQDDFSFAKAGEFASLNWKAKTKVEALRISESQQIALSAIQMPSVATKWRELVRESDALYGRLKSAADAPVSRVRDSDVDDYFESLVSLRLANGSPTLATTVYQWKTGKTISQQKMSGRAKWLRDKKLLS